VVVLVCFEQGPYRCQSERCKPMQAASDIHKPPCSHCDTVTTTTLTPFLRMSQAGAGASSGVQHHGREACAARGQHRTCRAVPLTRCV
jgi:hypothetical protein